MQIDSMAQDTGPSEYWDEDFRNVLEDHMTYLRTHPKTYPIIIDPKDADVYSGDFDMLLSLSKYGPVPLYMRWLVLRMNNMQNSITDPLPITNTLLIPDATVVDQIRQSHIASRTVAV